MAVSSPPKLGRYEIIEEIGKGAMGVVYLARDPLIGRLVALKTFRVGFSVGDDDLEQFRARFIREAQSAGILSHPNIVTIHDVQDGREDGFTFIAMEYVPGVNLKEVLQRGEPLELAFVVSIIQQVADALDYAHSKGVVHRDVKPANVIIDLQKRVKITDFGIARLESSNLTQDGQLLGTPNYMAPEQILGRELDHRADVFSLGVVLYELLTRNKPFQGENLTVVSHRIAFEEFTPPTQFVADLRPEIEEVLAKALAKEPAKRYPTAGALAEALRGAAPRAPAPPPAPTVAPAPPASLSFAAPAVSGPAGPIEGPPLPPLPVLALPPALPLPELADSGRPLVEAGEVGGEPAPRRLPDVDAPNLPSGQDHPPPLPAARQENAAPPVVRSPPTAEEVSSTTAGPVALPSELASAAPSPAPAVGPPVVVSPAALAELPGASASAPGLPAAAPPAVGSPGRPAGRRLLPLLVVGVALLLAGAAILWLSGAPAAPGPDVTAGQAGADLQSEVDLLLARASSQEQAGDLDGALATLDQAALLDAAQPAVVQSRQRVEEARSARFASAQRETEIVSLLEEGEAALGKRQAAVAAERARSILALVPGHPGATDLAKRADRQLAAERSRQAAAAAPAAAPPAAEAPPMVEPATAAVDPNTPATLAIDFLTEISEGALTIYVNKRQVVLEPFRFVKRTGLLRSEPSAGRIEVTRPVAPGDVTIQVYANPTGRPAKTASLQGNFLPGSTRTLKIQLAKSGEITASLE